MARVSLVNVSKIYPAAPPAGAAVSNVSLEIGDGEFVVLVGPSGCGKSTTLRMIAGLETVSTGTVSIGDRVVNDVPPSERDLAMVFQSYALYPHMTVRENLAFALTLRKLPRHVVDERVRKASSILVLDDLLARKPKQLSGGQRQRVALGRAIVREPQAFLFDEPLSNLDAALRSQMRREIAALHRTLATTMIYVTHDQVEAMTLGQRIVVMKAGTIQQVDTPLRLYNVPANRFVAGFIGSPAMNFFECVVDASADQLLLSRTPWSLPIEGAAAMLRARYDADSITIGVRAEHVRVVPLRGGALGDAPREASLPAVVEMVEMMGCETHVFVRLGETGGGGSIVSRAPAHAGVTAGDRVRLALDMGHVHCFDGATGERIQA